MSSLKDKVTSITKAFGLPDKGSLRQNVDELCKATDVTFTTMKETVDALSCVCEFANEVVPKLCEDSGVEATGKLGDDVATLCKEIGVDQDDLKFPMALNALVESMGVDVKPNTLMKLVQLPMFAEAQKEPAVKKVDAPCVCKNGLHQLMSCKAKSHPCVCKDICRNRYVLPEFAEMKVYTGGDGENMTTEAASSPITIQQLATHTSGLSYSFMPGPIGSMYVSEEVERGLGNVPSAGGEFFTAGTKPPFNNLREWTKALAEIPLVAQPGTIWNYSVGMDVMGALIEELSGMSFGEFLEERI